MTEYIYKPTWDIGEHPRYKLYPELQDAVFAMLAEIPKEERDNFLATRYSVHNQLDLHSLSLMKLKRLEQELLNRKNAAN